MGYHQPPSVSQSLAYLCSLLYPFGLKSLSPQILLLASANHPAAIAPLWSSLHRLICLQLARPSSASPVENVLLSGEGNVCPADIADIAAFVQFYLSLWGYPPDSQIFSRGFGFVTGGSQHLLLPLGWLLSKGDMFRRALTLRMKETPPSFPLRVTDVSGTSTALEAGLQARSKAQDYVEKILAASSKIADTGIRARTRSKQILMLYGRVRMTAMTLHAVLSKKAGKVHELNQVQLASKIKGPEGYPYSQFDLYLLENKQVLEKHFVALEAMKNIGMEMLECERYEKAFWQWMIAVGLHHEFPSSRGLAPHSQNGDSEVISRICTDNLRPVLKYLKLHISNRGEMRRSANDYTFVEPLPEMVVTAFKELSITNTKSDEIRTLFDFYHFLRLQGQVLVHEPLSIRVPHPAMTSDAEKIVERLKYVATRLVQELAQLRARNRTILESAVENYVTTGQVLYEI